MILDFHAHVGGWDWTGAREDVDQMLYAMDQCGVDKSCLSNIQHGDARKANDLTAKFVAGHPDRFIAVAAYGDIGP